MASKILNFPDAMKLASILSKYVDIVPEEVTGKYILEIFSRLTDEENLFIVQLFVKKAVTPNKAIELCVFGIGELGINELLSSYKKLGFADVT